MHVLLYLLNSVLLLFLIFLIFVVTEWQTAILLPYSIAWATSKKIQYVKIFERKHYNVLVSKTTQV